MSDGTKTWQEMFAEFEAVMDAGPIPTLPVAVRCADPNPWDHRIRCELPSGHRKAHRAENGLVEPEYWRDHCHWPGDDCDPCENPGRRAA